MKTMKLLCLALAIFSLVRCTRDGDTAKVNLSIPTSSLMQQKVIKSGVTLPPPPLQTLIVNVQVPNGNPLVKQMDFHDGAAVPSTIDITFDTVPTGVSLLVQVLAVYGGSGGAMQLKYGDLPVTVSGNTDVTVQLSSAGAITKQAYLAGRLRLGTIYPSGTLLGKFQPPGGKPKMTVDQSPIVGGYFNIFSVSNGTTGATAPTFDYVWVEGGNVPVFTGLNPDLATGSCTASSMNGSCPYDFISSDRVKIHKPASYSRSNDSKNPAMRSNSEMEYVLGFFGGASGSVCYPNDVTESLPGLFAAASDLATLGNLWQTPMDIVLGSTPIAAGSYSTTATEYAGGGMGASMSSLYTNASSCSRSSIVAGSALVLNHTLLNNRDEDFAGFQTPWMMVQPFSQNGSQYLSATVVGNVGSVSSIGSGVSSIVVSGLSFVPPDGSLIKDASGVIAPGTTVTSVTGSGPYTLNLSTPTIGSSSPDSVELSPQILLNWQTVPGLMKNYSGISLGTSSNMLTDALFSSGPPNVGDFVVDPAFNPGTFVQSVTPGATAGHFDVKFSTNSLSGGSNLNMSSVRNIEIWTKYNLNLQGSLTAGSNVISSVFPPNYIAGVKVGMPIRGGGGSLMIPAGAVVTAKTASTITISAAATGTGTSTASLDIGDSNSGGGDECEKLPSSGYVIGATISPSLNSFPWNGIFQMPPGPNINYQFAICAAKDYGSYKAYMGRSVRGQIAYRGDDHRSSPFGWAPSTFIDPIAGANTTPSGLGMSAMRVSSVAINPASGITTLTTTTSTTVVAGKEIMIRVMGSIGTGCGPGMNVGDYTYARVLNASTGSIDIPIGTWADRLATATNLGTSHSGMESQADTCFVQAIKVPHFRNLSLGTVAPSPGVTFDYNDTDIGFLGFRVTGNLTLNGNLDMSGAGFKGADTNTSPYNTYGGGIHGPANTTFQTGNGGGPPDIAAQVRGGGGGGGYGNGSGGYIADVANFGGQGISYMNSGDVVFNMGGGGAGINGSQVAGNGGGVIAIAANRISLNNTVIVSANGADPAATYSGAGGGGSVNVVANQIIAPAAKTITLKAHGGNGGDGTTSRGGAGGGGFAALLACNVDPLVTIGTSDVAAGVAATTPAASPGFATSTIGIGNNTNWWCN